MGVAGEGVVVRREVGLIVVAVSGESVVVRREVVLVVAEFVLIGREVGVVIAGTLRHNILVTFTVTTG